MMDDFFLSYGFIQRALLAGLLGGVGCGLAGVFVVLLRISFVGVCIAHAALAGALISVFMGLSPLTGAMTLSLLAAATIGPLAEKGAMSPDTATGVIFSVMLSASMLMLGLLPGARSDGLGLIWGSILTVGIPDVWLLACIAVALTLFVSLLFKEVQAVLATKKPLWRWAFPHGLFLRSCLSSLGRWWLPASNPWEACSSIRSLSLRRRRPTRLLIAWA